MLKAIPVWAVLFLHPITGIRRQSTRAVPGFSSDRVTVHELGNLTNIDPWIQTEVSYPAAILGLLFQTI